MTEVYQKYEKAALEAYQNYDETKNSNFRYMIVNAIEDASIDMNVHIKSLADIVCCRTYLQEDVKSMLKTLSKGHENDETYKNINADILEFAKEIIEIGWDEISKYVKIIREVLEFIEHHNSEKYKIEINEKNMPFGWILPMEIQEEILAKRQKYYDDISKYVCYVMDPIVEYLEDKYECSNMPNNYR